MLVVPSNKTQGGTVGKSVTARLLAAALLLWLPLHVLGAGLGKLSVNSALGQPLSAEIEIVSLQPGEEDSLTARFAPSEAYRQAGIEFNSALLGVRFAIERRNNRPVIRISSTAPISEPFLNVLVELAWNSGKLVREYTFPNPRARRSSNVGSFFFPGRSR